MTSDPITRAEQKAASVGFDVDELRDRELRLRLNEKARRVRIFGVSGAGKSFLAKRMARRTGGAVWLTSRYGDVPRGFTDYRTWSSARERLADAGQVALRLPKDAAGRDVLEEVQADLFRAAKAAGGEEDSPVFTVYHDEAQKTIPQRTKDRGARAIATEGRKLGVGYVLITQAPSQVSTRVRAQATITVLFQLQSEERSWMREADVPPEIREWVAYDGGEESRRFAVDQGGGWEPFLPVDP